MRVLTVRQPWAYAIIHLGKDVENRSRNIAGAYRGPVAIHAGLDENQGTWWAAIDPPFGETHFGAIIGVVDLIDLHSPATDLARDDHCESSETGSLCSAWADRRAWHLVLANPRPLSTPIPFRGALGLRRLPDEVIAQIEAQLQKATQ